jgi:hypothetical protein
MLEIEAMIQEAYAAEKENNDPWQDSPYRDFLNLTLDTRGKLGEQIISQALSNSGNANLIIEEDVSDVNVKGDGVHYDMKVNGLLIEIKTAYRGKGNSWQHENLYVSAADMSIFLDIDYQGLYITVIPEKLLPLGKDSPIFGRKHGTLRKNKDDGYKLDFSQTTLKTFFAHGESYCKYFDESEASLENIGQFIAERICAYADSI